MAEHDVSLYRAIKHMNHGGLHRALHVKESEPIPAEKLEKARHSKNPHMKHMLGFMHVLGGLDHDKK